MTDLSNGIKRIISLFLMLAASICCGLGLRVSADSFAEITVPDEVPKDSEFSVQVTFTSDENIGTARATLSYSEYDIQFISSKYASGGGGYVTISAFPQSTSSELTVTLTFKALREGSSQLSLTNGSVMTPDGLMSGSSFYTYTTLNIGNISDNSGYPAEDSVPDSLKGTLATMTVTEGQLVPAFSPGIYDYTLTLPHEIDYVGVDAEPAGKYDTIWFEGSEYLADGSTLRTVTVTSADGEVNNVYTINIIRLPAESEEVIYDPEESPDSDISEMISAENSVSDSLATHAAVNSVAPRSRSVSVADTEPPTLHDKLMPVLIGAMALIALLSVILVIRIRTRQKNKFK